MQFSLIMFQGCLSQPCILLSANRLQKYAKFAYSINLSTLYILWPLNEHKDLLFDNEYNIHVSFKT